MDLILIRHAESEGNSKNIMQGRMDFSLTKEGKKQAAILAKRLKDYTIDAIYTSNLKRALHTARVISEEHPKTPLIIKDEITEIHCGVFTGLTWSEAKKKYPDVIQQCSKIIDLNCIPGAESTEEVDKRITSFIDFILSHREDFKRIVVVSHGGFLKRLLKKLLRIKKDALLSFTLANASVSELFINDIIRVKKINSTFHLYAKTF